MEAEKEQLFNNIMRNFALIENLLLYENILETHFRTLIELARLLEDTSKRLITNHEALSGGMNENLRADPLV